MFEYCCKVKFVLESQSTRIDAFIEKFKAITTVNAEREIEKALYKGINKKLSGEVLQETNTATSTVDSNGKETLK